MSASVAAHPGRGFAFGLAAVAALASAVLMFAQTQTWQLWAWTINQPQSAAALSVGLFAGAMLLVASAIVGTAGAIRLAFLTTITFCALALWVTLGHHLLTNTGSGTPRTVAFLWTAALGTAIAVCSVLVIIGPRTARIPTTELPLILVAPVLIPAALFGWAGVTLLDHPQTQSLVPWAAAPNDVRLFGAVLVAVAVGSVLAVLERDANALLGGALGAGALGVGMLVVAGQVRDTFPWQATSGVRYLIAAAVLMALGGLGIVLHAVMPNAHRWERFVRAERGPRSTKVAPLPDAGFFGPDSVTWRVWSYPTSTVMGFQRAVGIEELDPFLIAAVDATKRIRQYPAKRYDYTVQYFATVAFGDSRSVVKASQALTRRHAPNTGIEPLSGKTYDANNPESQLWILVTAWHSILKVYEMYGPGPLSRADEEQYWAECAIAAEFQTIDPATVPRTREEVRAYFDKVRPGLVASPVAVDTFEYLINVTSLTPDLPRILRPGAKVINAIVRAAIIATLPGWMREQTGINQPAWVGKAVAPWIRMAFGFASRFPWLEIQVLKLISPSTIKVVEHVLYGVHGSDRRPVSTPAQAFATHGVPTPAEIIAGGASHPGT